MENQPTYAGQNPLVGIENGLGFSYSPRKIWAEYDLQTYDVSFKAMPTDLQAIVYKGKFIAFRSKDYYVFPHEDIFHTIDPVMAALKGEPVTEHITTSNRLELVYGKNQKIAVESNYKVHNGRHVNYGARIRTAYLFKDEQFDATGNGDIVKFGASISNGIDGGMSLQISPFSYRQSCSNGMMHLSTVAEISESIIAKLHQTQGIDNALIQDHVSRIMEESKSFDDLIAKIKKDRMSHLTKIPLEWVTSRIYLIKESIQMFRARYREMTELLLTVQQANKIADELPQRLLDKLEWLEIKDEFVEGTGKDGKPYKVLVRNAKITEPVKQWRAFNDITENLTHVQRAFQSKADSYRKLDKILVMNKA